MRALHGERQLNARSVTPDELEQYRIALETRIAASSLRAVALAVGMSPTGLTKFLDGGSPYGKTIERLRDWYSRETGQHRVRPQEIADQLRRMVGTLPHPDRGVANLLEAVERSYSGAAMIPPDWIRAVRSIVAVSS
jgi:adenosylmethionine-8-amino-7-oxononanoate aminotransferase